MSVFPGAQNTVINGGNFIAAQSIQVSNNWEKERYAIQILEQRVAFGAFHNSHDRYDAPRCLPRTREAVFQEIGQWIHITSIWKPILWLYGPAGSGKSAIAQSIAEKSQEMHYLLVGTYFFNRSDGLRNNTARLVPSLAYQLILAIPSTREHVLNTIIQEPGLFSLNLKTQMEKLIFHPLIAAGVVRRRPLDTASYPMLIIVDGLDEYQEPHERTAFLEALIDTCTASHFPLIILCHSRPESDIRAAFNNPQTSDLSARLVLDNKFDPDSDIRTYLTHYFAEIKEQHILKAQIPDNWPSRTAIQGLVRKSSGQFIYASTVVKHVASRRHNPMKRLEAVLSVGSGSDTSPFKELDALYRIVISSVDEENRSTICRIIGMICSSPRRSIFMETILFPPISITISPAVIDQVLNLEAGTTLLLIDDLHSLIDVRGPTGHLQPFHASLGDFLQDRSRSGTLYVDPGLPLADHLLAYFNKVLLNVLTFPKIPRGRVGLAAPNRNHFSEAILTVELLEFFERFPWERIPTENVPGGGFVYPDETFLIRHVCESYTFCKMASTKSSAWAAVYHRALRGLVAWVDCEMAHPSSSPTYSEPTVYFDARDKVLQLYVNRLLNLSDNFKNPNSELIDMALDVLQTPGLSCIHHISPKPHNSLILTTLLGALLLNRFPHARSIHLNSCIIGAINGQRCCQRCRMDIAELIDLSNRTSYLDVLLPYIETEVCRPDWVPEEGQYDSIGELKAAISRYRMTPIPDYYDYNCEWNANIPSLQAAVERARQANEYDLWSISLSDVLPFSLTIFE